MKRPPLVVTPVLAVLAAAACLTASAQSPVFSSLSRSGELVCSNLGPACLAAVEWAPTPTGPWTDSWAGLERVVADSNGTIRVSVPMFYRVRMLVPPGMALIPGGSFTMGDTFNEGKTDERPAHGVDVSAFYIDRTEVTNDKMVEVMQWAYEQGKLTVTTDAVRNLEGEPKKLLDLGSSYCRITWDGSQFGMKEAKGSGYPCVGVTWYGAVAFCNYRSQMEGLTACCNLSDWSCDWSANGYRVPTEAEWEKAARSGTSQRRFPWGDTIDQTRANYYSHWSKGAPYYRYDLNPTAGYPPEFGDGVVPYSSPVGSFEATGSAPGLYDMVGNVWEWCWDWYSDSYYGNSPLTDPAGPASGFYRVGRGSSYHFTAADCRTASRVYSYPEASNDGVGFRCVRPADL